MRRSDADIRSNVCATRVPFIFRHRPRPYALEQTKPNGGYVRACRLAGAFRVHIIILDIFTIMIYAESVSPERGGQVAYTSFAATLRCL